MVKEHLLHSTIHYSIFLPIQEDAYYIEIK